MEKYKTKNMNLQLFANPKPPLEPSEPIPPTRYHHIDLYRDGEFIKQYITEISDSYGSPPINYVTALWYYYKDNNLYLYVTTAFVYTPSIEEVITYGDKYQDISNNYIKDEESGTFETVEDYPWNLYQSGPSSGIDEKRLDIFSSAPQPTSKVSIDLTTLSGWSSLSDDTHSITVKAKASGYRDSAASEAVIVTKSSGETWVINETVMPVYYTTGDNPNFVSNSENFNVLYAGNVNSGPGPMLFGIKYDNNVVYDVENLWANQAYCTVTFETAPTGDLLTWLQSNAVKQ